MAFEIGDNFYADKPLSGTIVGQLTEEELAELQGKIRYFEAVKAVGISAYTEKSINEYMEADKAVLATWMKIVERIGMPYAWEITYDPITKYLYIV